MGFFLDETRDRPRSGWVIALFAVLAAVTFGIGNTALSVLRLTPTDPLSLDDGSLFFTTMVMLVTAGVPTIVCAFALKAEIGLPLSRALKDLGLGLALGAGLVTAAVGIPFLAGQATLTPFEGSFSALGLAAAREWVVLAPTSVGEELLLRGVVLRQLMIATRPWVAVALTGCAFGLMHLLNPGASALAALNVAGVGLWFGVLAVRTSLWTSIAAHTAWNFFEGFVFGQPVSGIHPGSSVFVGSVHAVGFFSGGPFGPEASVLTTVLLVLATAAAAAWPKKP